MELKSCLITGGAGFLGRALATELAGRGCDVAVLDSRPASFADPRIRVFTGDIRDPESFAQAASGVDTVFHTASVVDLLSVYDRERRDRVVDINVGGTTTIIESCRALGVRRLVYTSSCQVTFTGQHFDTVTEDMPYAENPVDLYGQTKQAAEAAVLAANGSHALLTCAIRPSGIYGPGEEHHLPRIVDQCARRLFCVLIGDGNALSEWSYIDNLVHGHLLAAEKLVAGGPACGQAYFINDEEFIDSIEMFRPLVAAMGYRWPRLRVPAGAAERIAGAMEQLHRAGGPAPLLTRVEVRKMSVRYPCSTAKARRELGYAPVVPFEEAVNRCIPYCKELRDRRHRNRSSGRRLALAAAALLSLTTLGAFTR